MTLVDTSLNAKIIHSLIVFNVGVPAGVDLLSDLFHRFFVIKVGPIYNSCRLICNEIGFIIDKHQIAEELTLHEVFGHFSHLHADKV